jgi:hypothetical protein
LAESFDKKPPKILFHILKNFSCMWKKKSSTPFVLYCTSYMCAEIIFFAL